MDEDQAQIVYDSRFEHIDEVLSCVLKIFIHSSLAAAFTRFKMVTEEKDLYASQPQKTPLNQ